LSNTTAMGKAPKPWVWSARIRTMSDTSGSYQPCKQWRAGTVQVLESC
jgi:hypothetical protein